MRINRKHLTAAVLVAAGLALALGLIDSDQLAAVLDWVAQPEPVQ